MQKTICDAILQFGIWQDVQTKDDYTYQRIVNKVFTQNKVLDNNTNFNWSEAFNGIVPKEFSPIDVPMKWDGTFNVSGQKRKYFSEAIADQFSDNEFYQRNYEYIARTASPEIVKAWSSCIDNLSHNRKIHCEVTYPELIPPNDEPISIRIDITKYSAEGDPGTKVYLSKSRLKKTLESLDLHLRSDSFIEEKVLLREKIAKRIIVVIPPSQRGKVIDLSITTSEDLYSSWVSFIPPLSAESPMRFTDFVGVEHQKGGDCSYLIRNDSSSRMIARVYAKFVCKNLDYGPNSRGDANFRLMDRTDDSVMDSTGQQLLIGRGYHTRECTADVHIAPKSSRKIFAQIFDYHSMEEATFEITISIAKSYVIVQDDEE